ncbi:MAG: hypothetical protein AB200_00005 [Parcubacteria bacterium C7867-005]|nr:MAG: hypothetical protein AB200_00005 [Parcubacteria bacterium C7867-005]
MENKLQNQDNDRDTLREKLAQSQGVKLSRPDLALRPKNRIEEFLPALTNKYSSENFVEKKETYQSPIVKSTNLFSRKTKKIITIVFVGLMIFIGYFSVRYFFFKNINDPMSVVSEVQKLTDLPKGEDPTIATVNDPTTLSNQKFFKDAKKGDRVLIYTEAKKAFLYRPSENRVVAEAIIN